MCDELVHPSPHTTLSLERNFGSWGRGDGGGGQPNVSRRFTFGKRGSAGSKGDPVENALFRVEAEARRLGGQCADMYFQEINITGPWVEARSTGGLLL